jgi:hypothetical protein
MDGFFDPLQVKFKILCFYEIPWIGFMFRKIFKRQGIEIKKFQYNNFNPIAFSQFSLSQWGFHGVGCIFSFAFCLLFFFCPTNKECGCIYLQRSLTVLVEYAQ